MLKRISLPFGIVWFLDKKQAAELPGNLMFATNLTIKHIRNGQVIEVRDCGSGVITTAGAIALAAGSALTDFKYHDSGSSSSTATIAQTDLVSPLTANEIGGRPLGTSLHVLNVYENVGNVQYSSSLSIAEWGIFNDPTAGTMLDRKTFSAISVQAFDFLQFIYALTIVPGG